MNRTAIEDQAASEVAHFDRRRHSRHDGAGLVVEVAGQSLPVVNVSTGGLSLRDLDRQVGDTFRLVLGRGGGIAGIATECQVVSREGAVLHLTFTRPTLPLLRLIVAHVSALTGVSPHLLTQD